MVPENDSIEYNYFMNFYEDNSHLEPFRTEWMVWDSELRLAGSIDMTFIDRTKNEIMIFDWKRCRN